MAKSKDGSVEPTRTGRAKSLQERSATELETMAAVGAALRASRAKLNRSIESVARQAGLDASYLGELERGRANVSITTLADLARVLDVSLVELLANTSPESSSRSSDA